MVSVDVLTFMVFCPEKSRSGEYRIRDDGLCGDFLMYDVIALKYIAGYITQSMKALICAILSPTTCILYLHNTNIYRDIEEKNIVYNDSKPPEILQIDSILS